MYRVSARFLFGSAVVGGRLRRPARAQCRVGGGGEGEEKHGVVVLFFVGSTKFSQSRRTTFNLNSHREKLLLFFRVTIVATARQARTNLCIGKMRLYLVVKLGLSTCSHAVRLSFGSALKSGALLQTNTKDACTLFALFICSMVHPSAAAAFVAFATARRV
jgi:hypothetical protein